MSVAATVTFEEVNVASVVTVLSCVSLDHLAFTWNCWDNPSFIVGLVGSIVMYDNSPGEPAGLIFNVDVFDLPP